MTQQKLRSGLQQSIIPVRKAFLVGLLSLLVGVGAGALLTYWYMATHAALLETTASRQVDVEETALEQLWEVRRKYEPCSGAALWNERHITYRRLASDKLTASEREILSANLAQLNRLATYYPPPLSCGEDLLQRRDSPGSQ